MDPQPNNDPTHDPVVITGAAMVTCLGADRETTWRAVRASRCGMGPLTAMEQPLPEGRDGGQAVDLPDDEEADERQHPREVRYLRRAIRDALADARLLGERTPRRHPDEHTSHRHPDERSEEGSRAGVRRLPFPRSLVGKPPRNDTSDPSKSQPVIPYAPDRCGVLFGTTLHGMRSAGQFLRTGDFEPLRHFLAAGTLRGAGRDLLDHFTALSATTCSACSSSLGSVALAVTLLRAGELDLVVAGGYDPVSEYVYGGFNSLRLVSERPLRPFARGRTGMKLAEGYGVVVLERSTDARRRGIGKPIATILGFGESADAHHLTQPHPQGDGAARAIVAALKSANLQPQDIDLIAAHATGTPDNDAGEYAALSRAFGESLARTPVVGFKSHLGHTLGGAGVVELILSAMAIRDGIVPACANVTPEEVEFPGLNLSTGASRPGKIRATLNTSLGFGGANTCVILGAPTPSPLYSGERAGARGPDLKSQISDFKSNSPSPRPSPLSTGARGQRRDVFITGVGVVFPGAVGNDAFVARLTDPAPTPISQDTGPLGDEPIAHLLNARRVRRMSEYVKLSLAATSAAYRDAGIADAPGFSETCSAILGSAHGSANYSVDYYGQIVREGIFAANPLLFAEGVPNAGAAHLSLMLALKGACQTIIGTRTAGLDALRLASARIASGEWERAVVSAGEEYSPLVNQAYGHCGLAFHSGCGAVTLVLESGESIRSRGGAPPRGAVEAWGSAVSFRERRDEVDSAAQVLRRIGQPRHVVSSANGTWIDRAEAAALRQTSRRDAEAPVVSSMHGHIAETFSAGPLAAIAAVLLTGKLPASFAAPEKGLRGAARTDARVRDFAVLCTDYAGPVAGCRVALKERVAA